MTTTTTTTELVPGHLDATRLTVASFLARYREPTLTTYTQDLRAFLGWCQRVRPGGAAGHPRRAGDVRASSRGPRVCRGDGGPRVCLLGMLGLRVSEACAADIADLRYEAGYELLHVLGKGAKPADIPLPIPVLRAVREAVGGRTAGPILRTRTGRRMDRAGASRALTRVARAAGITRPISPHGLRRTFCTTGLVAGIGIRDMQYAMRHADPRTTMRYDMAKANLDRHAAHAVAAYLAGMSTG
jgi:Phage integrase family